MKATSRVRTRPGLRWWPIACPARILSGSGTAGSHPPRPRRRGPLARACPRAGYGRPRTPLNIDAATCSHHDSDTEQASRRTVAPLTALPVDYRTGLVRRRALDLYEAIPAQHHHERPVRELRDVVAG